MYELRVVSRFDLCCILLCKLCVKLHEFIVSVVRMVYEAAASSECREIWGAIGKAWKQIGGRVYRAGQNSSECRTRLEFGDSINHQPWMQRQPLPAGSRSTGWDCDRRLCLLTEDRHLKKLMRVAGRTSTLRVDRRQSLDCELAEVLIKERARVEWLAADCVRNESIVTSSEGNRWRIRDWNLSWHKVGAVLFQFIIWNFKLLQKAGTSTNFETKYWTELQIEDVSKSRISILLCKTNLY